MSGSRDYAMEYEIVRGGEAVHDPAMIDSLAYVLPPEAMAHILTHMGEGAPDVITATLEMGVNACRIELSGGDPRMNTVLQSLLQDALESLIGPAFEQIAKETRSEGPPDRIVLRLKRE